MSQYATEHTIPYLWPAFAGLVQPEWKFGEQTCGQIQPKWKIHLKKKNLNDLIEKSSLNDFHINVYKYRDFIFIHVHGHPYRKGRGSN